MGGRGASLGVSKAGNKYGTQYETVHKIGNIKFVKNRVKNAEALMETQTKGRIYVQVGGENLLRIVLFDSENKRNKVIEKDKRTNKWHVHKGYEHTEFSETKHEELTEQDKKIVEIVEKEWYKYIGNK